MQHHVVPGTMCAIGSDQPPSIQECRQHRPQANLCRWVHCEWTGCGINAMLQVSNAKKLPPLS